MSNKYKNQKQMIKIIYLLLIILIKTNDKNYLFITHNFNQKQMIKIMSNK